MFTKFANDFWRAPFLALAFFAFALVPAIFSAHPSQGAAIVERETNILTLELGRGVLVRLDRAAANVFVANPLVADVQVKSPKLIYVFGQKPGSTTFYAIDSADNVIYSAKVDIEQNIAYLQDTIDRLLPDASVRVSSVNGMIILTGHVKSPADADLAQQVVQQSIVVSVRDGDVFQETVEIRVINRIQVATPTQVNIRVKMAEMSRDILKTLGFNWDVGVATAGGSFFGFAQGADFVNIIRDDNQDEIFREFLRRPETNSAVFNSVGGRHDVNAMIDALEDEGYISILAEPNLTAISGEAASFLAGGEFPVPVPQSGVNVGALTIEFKSFGVGLAFVPTVLSENKISLNITPEVSQLSSTGAVTVNDITIPALTTRRVHTTVELGSGQSFAIAGLLQSNITQQVNKYPFLGDIPILGTLFRSDTFQRQETELVVIATPYIVRPVNQSDLVTPIDINSLPADTGRWIKGKRDLKGEGGLATGEGG